jgi:hypothetical protein
MVAAGPYEGTDYMNSATEEKQPALQQKNCPFCGEPILAVAKKCKHCGEFLEGGERSTDNTRPSVQVIKEGHITFSCSYDQAYAILQRAMSECEVKVKERSLEKGLLVGKNRVGINPFGMTVTAAFYSDGGPVHVEITATFTDSFDTFGYCSKKISQITDRVQSLTIANSAAAVIPTTETEPQSVVVPSAPPTYSERMGPSFQGKATTGFALALGGLLFVPTAFVGLVMCAIALRGMSTSTNKAGKGLATAGAIIGFIAILGWIVFFTQ